MTEVLEFFKKGFYYMWKMDLIIFLVLFIGVLLIFLIAWIRGKVQKHKNITDDNENP